MFSKKAQGTIEYLVIIAIVIVIALVVVGLLLQVMNNSGSVPEQTAKIAWNSVEPFAITDWTLDSSDDYLTVVLKNNSFRTLTFVNIVTATGDINDTNASVAPGATITRRINTGDSFNSGDKYSYSKDGNMYITYNTENLNGQKQFGAADIVGTAS